MSVPNIDPDAQPGASFYEAPRASTAPDDHNEVAAALARFQAKLACANYFPRPRLARVWAACAVLTAAAFVGGLSLARFSFNSPEHPVSILTRAPELIYLPPENPAAAFADLRSAAALRATPVVALGGAEARQSSGGLLDGGAASRGGESNLSAPDARTSESGDLNFHELGSSWAEAVRLANVAHWATSSQPEPLQHGYAAVEVSPIPESPTGLIVGVAVAAIVAWGHTAKQRKQRA